LHGNIAGKMVLSKTNILGWKRYIYGQHKIIKYLYHKIYKKDKIHNKNKFLLNIRFDLFTNSYIFPYDEIIMFINNNYNNYHEKNIFLREGEYCGIDNIIIGSIKTNYKLLSLIHYQLDDILLHNKNLEHPEFIISRVNNLIFN